jgi:hypothetical protein
MKEFKRTVTRFAEEVKKDAKSILTKKKASGILSESIKYTVKQNRDRSGRFQSGFNVTFDFEDYGKFIDKGVHGATSSYIENKNSPYKYRNKKPHSSFFEKWIKQKGIKGRIKKEWKGSEGKAGRFITDKSLSYLIARSIYQKGIKASMFFTKPFEANVRKFGDDFVISYANDILNVYKSKRNT